MSKLAEAGKADELQEGTMKEISVEGHKLLLARVGGQYYAADNTCPHMRGNLAKGKLEGTVVTCPRHGSQFDLTNGHVVRWLKKTDVSDPKIAEKIIITYNVTLQDGKIMVEI